MGPQKGPVNSHKHLALDTGEGGQYPPMETARYRAGVLLMTSIVDFMTQDHRHCDDSYAAAEEKVAAGHWDEAGPSWKIFRDALETHLKREESFLFPAFEAQTGNTQGPTAVMRM